ncbi:MAG TPA: type I-U CRISPR-associated protein Csx17 [Tepidisphaeraceae bacterium]|jgi:CRISPR-associated protein Csx17|nr:type I-U CRISPR-associated protein Csx17 [Tepidisphaeraceae bacterium]
MSLHLHTLKGCAPAPLAHYLKALGILRLVGQQADPDARGWWNGERFCLLTKLSKDELEQFFLEKYEPTPIFNPWGGRSGFYAGSSEKTARAGLTPIEQSTLDRLANFRRTVAAIRDVIDQFGGSKPEKADELRFLSALVCAVRGTGAEWLATVVADLGDRFAKPAIFGSGGNEGSGSYTSAFFAALVECIVARRWDDQLAASLWHDQAAKNKWDGGFKPPATAQTPKPKPESIDAPFRQYLPGGEGSPWDVLFAFEGAIIIQSGVARRSNLDQNRFLASPFYFAALGIGTASSSEMDEFALKKGKKNPGRGEQWFPLWSNATTFTEVQTLFREGHCTVGKKIAKQPIDAAKAICSLGTSRGIQSFSRFGYLQRDNLTLHFAVPLGRINVPDQHRTNRARLADDLGPWMDRLHRIARKDKPKAPDRLVSGYRRLADAVFPALTHDPAPDRWQAILLAAADVEAIQATGTAIEPGPIPTLRPDWVDAVNDGSIEVRLALALGSASVDYSSDGKTGGPIRHHVLPLEPFGRKFRISDKRLLNDPRVVVSARDPVRDLAAIVERRMIEAEQSGRRRLGLVAASGCGARLDDLAQLLDGHVDLDRTFRLARAFMAIDWRKWHRRNAPPATPFNPKRDPRPDDAWLAIRLAAMPFAINKGIDIPADPRVIRLLMAGDGARAIEIARRRIRAAGIRPPFVGGMADTVTAQRWAAALAFPIHRSTAQQIVELLDPSKKGLIHV